MRDLLAGRLDMAVLDPGLVQHALQQHPEWALHQVALVPEPERFPIMSIEDCSIIGIGKDNAEPHAAINDQIQKAWASCLKVETMTGYGPGDRHWFTPPKPNDRVGVDRPEGRASPTAAEACFKRA